MGIGRGWWDGRKKAPSDQMTGQNDALSTGAVGEKAVIADADQAGGQHMEQEAAEELIDLQGEPFLGIALSVVAMTEADALAVEGDDTGVADGDAVGVVGQVREHLLWSAERRLAVDDPVGRASASQKQVEGEGVGDDSLR